MRPPRLTTSRLWSCQRRLTITGLPPRTRLSLVTQLPQLTGARKAGTHPGPLPLCLALTFQAALTSRAVLAPAPLGLPLLLAPTFARSSGPRRDVTVRCG
jgi:hypothetical protein